MLSIQKSPTDKICLGYVAPSTSKTVFVKPTVLEPPLTVEDKGKDKVNDDVPGTQKPHSIRRPPICHHCGLSGHVHPQCSLLKAQKAKAKKEVPQQADHGTRPVAQFQTPWYRPHTIKHQDIKLLGLMDHDTRHPSISGLSNDLYLPITVATPRTIPSNLGGIRR